ncbi:MAG: hypothetical protein C5B50_24950 [Verrucomicrobia bacterium]|nr:MAG: hypothetical protein C5B50_24950 [Verrucomicrobiota bacterium]
MPKDSVLRALVSGKINGQLGEFIVDAFERGDTYGLVLEWTSKQGETGEFPNRAIGVPKKFFDVITDPSSPYEIKCLRTIDFDDLLSGERTVFDAEEIWGKPNDLFYPRPNDENPG